MIDAKIHRCLLPAALALGLFATTSVAAAGGDSAAAEVLFREGKQLMAEGHYDRACPKLAESYRLDPATGALLATALCYERGGRLASAWAAYTDAIARAKAEGSPEREQSARSKAAELEPKLDRLVVSVAEPDAPGLVVKRDGVAIGQAEWGTAIPVDAGAHVVEATADGKARFRTEVSVEGATSRRVNIPVLTDLPTSSALPASEGASPPPASDSAPKAPRFWTPLRATGTVTAVVGVAALGVGAVFGARALSLHADSKKDGHCNETSNCDPTGEKLRNDARDAGTLSTVAIVGGLVLAATGVTLFAVGAPEDAALGVWVTPPLAGAGGFGIRGRL